MIKKIKLCFAMAFLLITPVFLSAQGAAELEGVLGTTAVSYAQAARFILAAAGNNVAQQAAFEQAAANGWLPRTAAADDPITLGSLSFLTMKAFDLKGGLMYMALPGPRYAFRSMVSRSIIQGAADPAMTVSGERFLLILGNVLNAAGGDQ